MAHEKAVTWSEREEEFVRRAGYALMAYIAVHDNEAANKKFLEFLSIIEGNSIDERNFVKKSCELGLAADWKAKHVS